MATTFDIRLEGDWKGFELYFGSERFRKTLDREVERAGRKLGRALVQEIRKRFRGLRPNAALTIAIKGRDDPLSDTGEMKRAVAFDLKGTRLTVGLKTSDSSKARIWGFVLKGGRIPVTESMRNLFRLLANVSSGGDAGQLTGRAAALYERSPGVVWKPLSPMKRHIRIPPRDVIKAQVEDPYTQRLVSGFYTFAVERALKGFEAYRGRR